MRASGFASSWVRGASSEEIQIQNSVFPKARPNQFHLQIFYAGRVRGVRVRYSRDALIFLRRRAVPRTDLCVPNYALTLRLPVLLADAARLGMVGWLGQGALKVAKADWAPARSPDWSA